MKVLDLIKKLILYLNLQLFQAKDKPLDVSQRVSGNFGADIDETFSNASVPLNFTQEQFKYAEAYRVNLPIFFPFCFLLHLFSLPFPL